MAMACIILASFIAGFLVGIYLLCREYRRLTDRTLTDDLREAERKEIK